MEGQLHPWAPTQPARGKLGCVDPRPQDRAGLDLLTCRARVDTAAADLPP